MSSFKVNWVELDGSTVVGTATISIDGDTCTVSSVPNLTGSVTGRVQATQTLRSGSISVTSYCIEINDNVELFLCTTVFDSMSNTSLCSGSLRHYGSLYTAADISH